MPANHLGPALAKRREELGRTQAEIGDAIGLSGARVGQLERGRVTWPAPDVFNRLAVALEMPVTELLRTAGIAVPASPEEELAWVIDQLSDEGRELLAQLGRALLPQMRRRP